MVQELISLLMNTVLYHFGHFKDEVFCVVPAKTGVSNGLAVYAFADLLAAFLNVTLDHDALNKIFDIGVKGSGVKYLFDDTDLFPELLVGVVVVGINDGCGIDYVPLIIEIQKKTKIFVMVIGKGLAMLVAGTTQYAVSKSITVGTYFIASVNKVVFLLSCIY